jgi:hypothetical protein
MRTSTIKPKFVDTIPDRLEEGILYVCERYGTAAHKCCCGCGQEVITPLSPVDWSLRRDRDVVSLTPSIGNWSYDCKSHYWIRRNKVVWAGKLREWQIARVRARDKADKDTYIEAINRQKEKQREQSAHALGRFLRRLVRWWQSL